MHRRRVVFSAHAIQTRLKRWWQRTHKPPEEIKERKRIAEWKDQPATSEHVNILITGARKLEADWGSLPDGFAETFAITRPF